MPEGIAALASMLLALTACSEGVGVTVDQAANGTRFATKPVNAGFDACIDRAYLYEEADQPRQVWYATRGSEREPCIREVRYVANPRGFSAKPPPPLTRGKRYRVELIGKGFTAAATFSPR